MSLMSLATEVRERPILFSGQMVRAILDGRKTQTRRVVKPQPRSVDTVTKTEVPYTGGPEMLMESLRCPYGAPGDRLWVREAWAVVNRHDHSPPRDLDHGSFTYWRADDPGDLHLLNLGRRGRWRPSIHMPRWASRIVLEVTGVRVERVQEISTDDVRDEGVQVPVAQPGGGVLWRLAGSNPAGKVPASYLPKGRLFPDQPPATVDEIAMAHFADLWDTTQGKKRVQEFGWDANPWVWVIGFRRVEP